MVAATYGFVSAFGQVNFYWESKQAMGLLRGMAEHRFSNVYNLQHFSLLWYLCKCFSSLNPLSSFNPFSLSLFFPFSPFMICLSFLVKTIPLCRGMACLPFQKYFLKSLGPKVLILRNSINSKMLYTRIRNLNS